MYSNLSKEELERIAQQARAKALADYAQNAELNKAHVEKIANVQAQREAGLINDNLADALSYGAKTGVNQMTSGIKSGVMGLQHTGAEMLGMQDTANSLAQKLQQNAQQQAQRQAEINAQYKAPFGMLAQGVADVTSGAIGMLPTVGAFALTPQGKIAAAGKVAQVGAKALGFAPMGLQAGGGGINQALNEGADIDEAKQYGLGTAVKEVATELPFAGIAKVPGIANVGQKLAGGNKFVGGAINAGLEGAEEAMAEAADPYIQKATYNPNAENASLGDMAYSALIGAATAGAINSSLAGAGKVANMSMNTKNQPKNAQNVPKNQQKMANAVQKPQNGTEQAKTQPMTNTLPRPNNGSQKPISQADFGRKSVENIQTENLHDISPKLERPTTSKMETVAENETTQENRAVEQEPMQYQDYDINQMSDDVRDFYNMVNEAGKRYGFNIRAVDKIENKAFGKYDGQGNILINGKLMTSPERISGVIGHEGYHYLKGTDNHKYIIDLAIANSGKDKETLIQDKIQDYYNRSKGNVILDRDGALDEIGASFMEDIMSNPALAEQIWREQPTLAERIVRFFKEAIERINARLNGVPVDKVPAIYKDALNSYQQGLRNMQRKQQGIGSTQYNLPNTNSNNRELTAEQAEYFKNSKVRDEKGNLKAVYHGTNEDFSVFKSNEWLTEKNGKSNIKGYFSENEEYARNYGKTKPYYLDVKNPLVFKDTSMTIDGWKKWFEEKGITDVVFDSSITGENASKDTLKGANFDGETYYSMVDLFDSQSHWAGDGNLTERIKAAGYDGMVWDEDGNAWMPFSPEQIKNVDNAKPTSNPDVRYNLPNTDSSGRELSKEQAEYFKNSKVRDENGRLQVAYHSTDSFGFNVFDKEKSGGMFFFTKSKDMAQTYAQDSGTYEVFLNIESPLIVDAKDSQWNNIRLSYSEDDIMSAVEQYVELAQKYDIAIDKQLILYDSWGDVRSGAEYIIEDSDDLFTPEQQEKLLSLAEQIDNAPDDWDADEVDDNDTMSTREIAQKAKEMGHDGVIIKNVMDNGKHARNRGVLYTDDVYIAFSPEQIKDVANKKPTADPDIRYSLPADDNADVNIVNKSGEVVAEQRGTEVRFNLGSYENGGSDVLQKYVDDMVKKKKIDADYGKSVVDQLETMYKTIKKLTTGDNAEKYSYFTAWSEVMPEFTDDGELVLSVATPNGEYPMNLDFSTRCAKRVAIDTLLMHMSASGIYDIAELTPGDFAMINQILKDHNLATACTMCFVETKRDKSASWASTIADEYNELLEAANIQNGVVDETSLSAKRKEMAEREEKATSMAMSERYAKYLRANAQNPIQLKASDLMHSEGMEKIKREAPDIFSIASSRYGAGTPKPLTAEGAYANEMIRPDLKRKGGKKKNPFTWKSEDAFKVGGVRLQSFSDFRVEMFFDYCQMIAEASIKGLPVQSYTKVPAFAKLFGMTGIKINMSLVPEVELTAEERAYIDSLTDKQKKTDVRFKEIQSRAGLSRKGRYLWAKESFDPELAYKLQNDDKYTNNVGTVAIGVSDAQIWQMLKDKNIRMIIPYHKSGIDAVVARAKNIDVFKNYESCQNHLIIDPSLPMLPNETYAQYYRRLVNIDKYGSKPTKKGFNFDFYGALKKENDPVKVSKKYVDECQKRNIAPKFPQFVYNQDGSFNENYYKMLIDFAVYNKNGEYTPQQAVKFDNEHLPRNWFDTLKKELAIDEADRKRMDAEIAGVAEEVVARLKTEERYSFGDLVDEYGAIPKGENPNGTNRDIDVPQQTSDFDKVSRWTRTAVESSNVDDTAVGMIEDELTADLQTGKFIYTPSGNKEQVDRANSLIDHTGWEEQAENFRRKYKSGQAMTADDIVLGERLIQEAQKAGDYGTAVDLIADVAAIGTELGKAVQALSVLKRLTPDGKIKALKRVEQRINSGLLEQGQQPVKLSNDLLERMLQTESEQMQSEIWDACIEDMANQVPATLADKINAWRYLAMLSNPKTHIRNFIGNGVMMGVSAVKRGIEYQLSNRLLTAGEERYAELNRNVPKKYFDFAEWAWENSGKDRARAGGGRYNDKVGIKQKQRIFDTDIIENAREFVIGQDTGLLDRADMWFKKKTYIKALARYMYANGLSPNTYASNMETFEKGEQYALNEAFKGTFQEASKVANLLAQAEESSPAAKLIMGGAMPFKKTPINILKRGVEYSPVGLMNGVYKMWHDVEAGKCTPAEAVSAISAGLTGTGIMVLGYFLASAGLVSAGSSEDDERKQWYDQSMGSQNYALVLPGGGTATIDWLAPSVMPLMAGAELYKQLTAENPANENSSAVTSTLEAISKVANPVLEMSMLQGVTNALQSYNSGTTGVLSDLITSTATSYGGQFIPAPVGALARTVDGTVRSSYAPKDSMLTKTGEKFARQQMNKLPFASMMNNPSVDVWGNEVEREGGNFVGRAFNNFLNPSTYSSDKRSELDNELNNLYKATGNSGVLPSSGTNYIAESESNPKVYLSHDEYFQYGNTRGQKSYQYVNSFVNSAAYAEMADEDKAEIISDLYSLANYQARKEALNGRGYNYTNSTYEKVLKSGMEAQNYYIVKYNLDGIADSVSTGQKQYQIAYLKDLQKDGTISDEQCWYLRRAIIGKFSKAEMASCPYAWIKNL
jgi:hypothetical protein